MGEIMVLTPKYHSDHDLSERQPNVQLVLGNKEAAVHVKEQMFSVSCVKEPLIPTWEIIPFIYSFFPPPHSLSSQEAKHLEYLTMLAPPSGEKEQLASGRLCDACLLHKTGAKRNERKNRSSI